MVVKDSLGDRIKAYEEVWNPKFTPNSSLLIRIDGKAFHTWTRKLDKPFDNQLNLAMVTAMKFTAQEMQGFKLGYTQSDEATFLLTDTYESSPWFDWKLNKIVSVTASMFTAHFNNVWRPARCPGPAMFDARAFVVPDDDVPNVFVWREKDFGSS